ncbi:MULTISPECIES: hypothetical protein [Aminobacterium]|uniref:hypothetical protein n=1 Tax=Aminobacterium TaxID=81466 RepID=UPI00257E92A9|nr:MULTISPECIES: hypothetical protein [unclassified Aminobacterium]
MKVLRKISFVAFVAGVIVCLLIGPSCGAVLSQDQQTGLKEGWIWIVSVLPPAGGWESDEGQSISLALSILEKETNESARGLAGYDVLFVKESPLEVGKTTERLGEWSNRVALLSFSGDHVDKELIPQVGVMGPLFLSAFGEGVSLRDTTGKVYPYAFALDLPLSYRAGALAQYGEKTLSKGVPVAQFVDGLDPVLSMCADLYAALADQRGRSSLFLGKRGAGDNGYQMECQEAIQGGAKAFILWLDALSVTDIYRQRHQRGEAFALWYGGEPIDRELLRCTGLIAVSQKRPLEEDPYLAVLERKIWQITRKHIPDRVAAARAWTSGMWLLSALQRAGTSSPDVIAKGMTDVEGITLGKEPLRFNSLTHRPEERQVAIMKVENNRFQTIAVLKVRGANAD